MLALVQPFGLHSPGGGARILRSLLGDTEEPYISICTSLGQPDGFDPDREIHLPIRPHLGRIERSRLRTALSMLTLLQLPLFRTRLKKVLVENNVRCIHAIPHGLDFWAAFEVAREMGISYVLNVHDDMSYNLHDRVYEGLAMKRLKTVWQEADNRMVISEAMGEAYNERYGTRPYEVITDGLVPSQIASKKRARPDGRLNIYFMGSVHLSYQRNFEVLVDATRTVAETRPDLDVRLIIRGGLPFSVESSDVNLEVRGWGTQEEVEADLDEADLLYFPLPFEKQHDAFVRLSLSTKMVTYLGSGLPILYHGPDVAAAARLLQENDAGILACSADPSDLAETILAHASSKPSDAIVQGALDLAERSFLLDDHRRRFWSAIRGSRVPHSTAA